MEPMTELEAIVQPKGKVELYLPKEFKRGQAVRVTILPIEMEPKRRGLPEEIIGSGTKLFRTAEEVNDYIRQERES